MIAPWSIVINDEGRHGPITGRVTYNADIHVWKAMRLHFGLSIHEPRIAYSSDGIHAPEKVVVTNHGVLIDREGNPVRPYYGEAS